MSSGANTILELAENLFREEKPLDAIELLNQAIDEQPDDLLLKVRLADYLGRHGDQERSTELYRACALRYADRGELAFAVALYKLLVPLNPQGMVGEDGSSPLLRELVQRYLRHQQQSGAQDASEISSSTLSQVRLFRDFSEEELQDVISRIVPHPLPAGSSLFRQGDLGSSLFIVTRGFVQVSWSGDEGFELGLARLGPGDFFGEWGFLSGENRRHASVDAVSDAELLELSWEATQEIIQQHPHVKEVLATFYRKRRLDTLIARVFPALTVTERRRLADCMGEETRATAGSLIYREGDSSESMSLILHGSVEIFTQNLDGDEISLATFGPGHYFGEGGALTGRPRSASVRARTDAVIYQISREDLVTSLVNHPEILNSLQGVGAERVGDTLEKLEGSEGF